MMKIYQDKCSGYKTYFLWVHSAWNFAYGFTISKVKGEWKVKFHTHYISEFKKRPEMYPLIGELDFKELVRKAMLKVIIDAKYSDKTAEAK